MHGPPDSGLISINNEDGVVLQKDTGVRQSMDKITQRTRTTIKSAKSASKYSNKSKKTISNRSIKSKNRSNLNQTAVRQSNDFYIVGSLDTINVDYNVNKERQHIRHK